MLFQDRDDKPLVLAFLTIAHILLQKKQPFVKAENVILPCLKVAAEYLHGGKMAVDKVKIIPLSNCTMKRRRTSITDNLKDQLFISRREAPCFGLKFDETTDVGNEEASMDWTKCVAVTSDGAAAMVGAYQKHSGHTHQKFVYRFTV